MKITVTNRSDWPWWLVHWAVRRACRENDVAHDYEWTQKSTSYDPTHQHWMGRGGRWNGYALITRRVIPCKPGERFAFQDSRFVTPGGADPDLPHTPIAMFLYLIAHEVAHAGPAHPSKFPHRSGTIRRKDMEFIANAQGEDFVKAIADNWDECRAEWFRLARAERDAEKARRARMSPAARADKRLKLRRAQLAKWKSRAKLAATKIRKLTRLIAAAERRMSTCRQ